MQIVFHEGKTYKKNERKKVSDVYCFLIILYTLDLTLMNPNFKHKDARNFVANWTGNLRHSLIYNSTVPLELSVLFLADVQGVSYVRE